MTHAPPLRRGGGSAAGAAAQRSARPVGGRHGGQRRRSGTLIRAAPRPHRPPETPAAARRWRIAVGAMHRVDQSRCRRRAPHAAPAGCRRRTGCAPDRIAPPWRARVQNCACSLGAPKACELKPASKWLITCVRASLIASVVGCALVTSTSRLPSARTLPRNSRAPGSQRMLMRHDVRLSAAISSSSSRLQYSMQYQSSVPSRARKRGSQLGVCLLAGSASARSPRPAAPACARNDCRTPDRAACRPDRAARYRSAATAVGLGPGCSCRRIS